MKNIVKSLLGVTFVLAFFAFSGHVSAATPIVTSFAANPTSVNSGGSTTITWNSMYASSCVGLGGGNTGWAGTHGFSGSFPAMNLTGSTVFSLYCVNSSGQQSNTVSISVTVNQAPPAPVVLSFSASPSVVAYGADSTLSWNSSNASYCVGTGGGNTGWANSSYPTSGNFTAYNLTSNTTFNIYCMNSAGQSSQTASITVTVSTPPPQAPTVNITANPSSVAYGGSSTVSWSSTNATSCFASGAWSGVKPTSGSYAASNLTSTATFAMTCTGAGGSASDSATVTVGAQPQPAVIVSFNANPGSVSYGGATQLSWSVTNATSCVASSNPGTTWSGNVNAAGGSQVVSNLTNNPTYFNLYCSGNGGSDSKTVSVSVGAQPQNPPTVSITANPPQVQYGGNTVVSWTSTNATTCNATGGSTGWSGAKSTSGAFTSGSLTSSVTYAITCNGAGGSASDSTTVTVGAQPQNPATILSFSANPSSVTYNGSTTLSWSVSNATSCVANSTPSTTWSGSVSATGGSQVVSNLTQNPTYFNLYCTGNGGSDSKTVSVVVGTQPPAGDVPTVTITAGDTDLPYGGATDIYWYPKNATSCMGTGGANGWAGTKYYYSNSFYTKDLFQTTTYTITCSNAYGTSLPASVTVHVAGAPVYNPSVTTNAATNIGQNSATLNGYVSANGGSNVYAWFEWGTNGSLSNSTNQVNYGSTTGTSFNYSLGGLQPNTTYYFRAVAKSANGQMVYGSQMSFTTTNDYCYNCNPQNPSVTTYFASNVGQNSATLNGYVNTNGQNTERWFEWGTSTGALYNSTNRQYQSYSGNFSETISGLQPNTTYYFRAVARGSYGNIYGNVATFTTNDNLYYQNTCGVNLNCTPTAVTTIATSISHSSARLNGIGLLNSTNVSTNGYFEWGTTRALGNVTRGGFIGSADSNPFYSGLNQLQPNTTYYFRAVVTNQYGVSRGEIQSFRTGTYTVTTANTGQATTTNTKIIYRNVAPVTNVVATQVDSGTAKSSLVYLTVNHNNEVLSAGSELEYVFFYKNVSYENLQDLVLQIVLPGEINFIATTNGYYNNETRTVVVNIPTLAPQEEGSVAVRVGVTTSAEIGKIIAVAGNLAYTVTRNGNQEEVFAYSRNTIGGVLSASTQNGNIVNWGLLGAAIFGTGFLPSTLIGWIILLLIILIIALFVRRMYTPAHGHTDTHGDPHAH